MLMPNSCSSGAEVQWTTSATPTLTAWPTSMFQGTPSGAAGAAKSSVHTAANEPIASIASEAPA